jgi:hypothetical protein
MVWSPETGLVCSIRNRLVRRGPGGGTEHALEIPSIASERNARQGCVRAVTATIVNMLSDRAARRISTIARTVGNAYRCLFFSFVVMYPT